MTSRKSCSSTLRRDGLAARFQQVNAPELFPLVASRAIFTDGVRDETEQERSQPAPQPCPSPLEIHLYHY